MGDSFLEWAVMWSTSIAGKKSDGGRRSGIAQTLRAGAAVMQKLSSNLSPQMMMMATAISGSMARAQRPNHGLLPSCRPERSIGFRLLRSIRQVRTSRTALVAAHNTQCTAAEQQLARQKKLQACLTAVARVVTFVLVMAVMPNKVLAAASAAGTGATGAARMLSVSPACKLGLATAALLAGPWLSKRRSRTLAPQVSAAAAEAEPADAEADAVDAAESEAEDNSDGDGVIETGSELGSVQTPASVWLPFETSTPGGKVNNKGLQVAGAQLPLPTRISRNINLLFRLPFFLFAALSFRAQQIMLGTTITKILAVFVVGIPACVVGGLAYSYTSGKSIMDGIIAAYGALYKVPGVTVIGETNAATANLMNILWLAGTFTFAVVLAVVTEDVVAKVLNIRKGNYPVVATNHTLVMGWNSQTVPLLRQIAINNAEADDDNSYPMPVVILAQRDKEEMDEELKTSLRGYSLEWHTRTGASYSMADLECVAAGQARNIILLDAGEEDAGEKQVASLLGIQAARAATRPRPFMRLAKQNIAMQPPRQLHDAIIVESAKSIMSSAAQSIQLTELSSQRDMSTLLAQSAVQPGVASVYCSIVQQTRNGVEFYIKHFPEAAGCPYVDARRMFAQAIVVGYMSKEGKVLHINPKEDSMLEAGDSVIVLSQSRFFRPVKQAPARPATAFEADKLKPAPVAGIAQRPEPIRQRPKDVVVAWWHDNIADLLHSLDMFSPRGTTVRVISEEKPKDWPEPKRGLEGALIRGKCTFEHVQGNPVDVDVLSKSGVSTCNAVLIGGVGDRQPQEADACTLSVLLILQNLLIQAGRDTKHPVHVVAAARCSQTIEVANYLIDRLSKGTVTAELVQPDELISGMISQVAAEPEMGTLLSQFIYSTAGQEIYLRRPSRYDLDGKSQVAFAQVIELARTKKESAIGYISKDGQMRLVPKPAELRVYSTEDRVIVIADD